MALNEYNKYIEWTKTVDQYPKENKIYALTLGLTSEAGEVAGKVKKIIRDHGGEITEEMYMELLKELGDLFWYFCRLSDELGMSLDDIIKANVIKLESRKERNVLGGDGDNR